MNNLYENCKCIEQKYFLSFVQWAKKEKGIEHWEIKAMAYSEWVSLYLKWTMYYEKIHRRLRYGT